MDRAYRPRLRELLAVPRRGDPAHVVLTDPWGIAERRDGAHSGPLRVAPEVWEVARLFDGVRTVEDVARERSLSVEDVLRIADGFSTRLLLDDERLDAARTSQLEAFRSLPTRPSVGSGVDYGADPMDLRIEIGGLVANDWDMPEVDVAALWTPALDFGRGGRLYSRTYGCLRKLPRRPARVLLLGAASASVQGLLVPFGRAFDTALGTSACDVQAVTALGLDPGADELAHRDELVLERHLLFLRLLLPSVPIVPVLVGRIDERESPRGAAEVEAAVDALLAVTSLEGETLVLVAADLSHVGPASASGRSMGPSLLNELRALDAETSDRATCVDADGLWRVGSSDADRARNLSGPYLMLRLLEARNAAGGAVRGSVLGYEGIRSVDEVVTAVTVAFH